MDNYVKPGWTVSGCSLSPSYFIRYNKSQPFLRLVWPDSWLATFCPVHRRLISFPFYRVLHLFLPTFLPLPPSFQPPSEEAQRGKSVSMPRLIECICQFYEFTRRAYRNGIEAHERVKRTIPSLVWLSTARTSLFVDRRREIRSRGVETSIPL